MFDVQEVGGSIPSIPTRKIANLDFQVFSFFRVLTYLYKKDTMYEHASVVQW